jgi:uncharacterized protein YkwD
MIYKIATFFSLFLLHAVVVLPAIAAETQVSTDTSWVSSLTSPGAYEHVRDGDITQITPEEYVNRYRALLGLPALTTSAIIQEAASDHVEYLKINGVYEGDAHAQGESLAGFTGADPNSRCLYRGYDEYCTEVQAYTSGDGDLYSGIDSWMMTPFHRTTLIDAGVTEIGCAEDDGWIVCDVGLDLESYFEVKGAADPYHYPADGQVISTTFYVAENPMPYPAYAYDFIGPTLMYWPLNLDSEPEAEVSVYDLTAGEAIETIISIDTANIYAADAVFFNPVEPLELDHEYAVYVTDISGDDLYDAMWTFKTQQSDNVDFPNADISITYDSHVDWADPTGADVLVTVPNSSSSNTSSNSADVEALIDRLEGQIMLAVDNNGEAWYIDPITRMRYYLADGPTAYEFLRSFGLGILNADLESISKEGSSSGGGSLATSLSGRVLIQVEEHGEAWYVNPDDLLRYYMADGDEAYRIMRELSLGTLMADISDIPIGTVE